MGKKIKRPPLEGQVGQYLRSVVLKREAVPDWTAFPFSIPAIRSIEELELDAGVTFFVGENGSGKSTLLEAIAIQAGFGEAGGTKNFVTPSESNELAAAVRLVRGARREQDGFFLRAETYFNIGSLIDALGVTGAYGGVSVHQQSHGEAFLALIKNRFRGNGIYLLDEPEAALSPSRQLTFLAFLHDLLGRASQMIIATHSPIVMSYPNATILRFDGEGIRRVEYRETEHFKITADFLRDPERFHRRLFDPEFSEATE